MVSKKRVAAVAFGLAAVPVLVVGGVIAAVGGVVNGVRETRLNHPNDDVTSHPFAFTGHAVAGAAKTGWREVEAPFVLTAGALNLAGNILWPKPAAPVTVVPQAAPIAKPSAGTPINAPVGPAPQPAKPPASTAAKTPQGAGWLDYKQ